jgi:uncharacterized damage-inducible protein DinB
MAEESFTLATIVETWRQYQERIVGAIAPLADDQLALRAAPDLRTVGQLAVHIADCRARWFTDVLGVAEVGEEGNAPTLTAIREIAEWDEQDQSLMHASRLVEALSTTWRFTMDRLARWSGEDMEVTFEHDADGETLRLSRAWVIAHILEHDLHHGGELALTLGMHGLASDFPG